MPISDKFNTRMRVLRTATASRRQVDDVRKGPAGSLVTLRRMLDRLDETTERRSTSVSEYAEEMAEKVTTAAASDEPHKLERLAANGDRLCPRDNKPMTRVVLPNEANAQFCPACRTTIPVDSMY